MADNTRSRSGSQTSQNASAVWSTADDEKLASARAAGMNWQPIAAQYFPNKTANACRKRHERLMERRYQEDWGQEKLEELAVAYFECRQEMWAMLGEKLGARWTMVENKVMEKGVKNLQNIARASYRKRMRLLDSDDAQYPQGLEYHHDEDNSANMSDADYILSRLHRPSSAPAMGEQRPLSPSPSPKRQRRFALDLPLYEPPTSVMGPRSLQPVTFRPTPTVFARPEQRPSTSPRDMCRIQSLLSPEE
ncbi:hypothetical protein K461DRAFT_290940 [Myriangium duriaei CBS 260.36]|uniref:Myb-like domain-containing protein n=1 Tax=Myriangium duriaei CBS 260.36 TaxID=1168546 RepID=A0A9P4J6H5_9PEZI|nr:hypothetical protein K461DRAFT_290940 [Myriangium duriaei CBS 260.36]